METPTKQTAHRLAAALAIITAFATTGAWAWDSYYWTGATSADFNTAANWTTNHVDAASEAPAWRSGKDLYFETADIVSYRVDFGGNSYGRGPWNINAGTEAQPLEFYCTKGSTIVSPDSSQYNYASGLTVASACDSWVWINGGQWDEFAGAVTIGSSGYAGHFLIGNARGVDTLFKTTGNVTLNQGSIAVSNATVNIGGQLTVGNTAGKLTSFDFYNSTMVIGNYFTVGNSAIFDLCGGSITNTANYLTVDNSAEMTIRDGGRYACQSQIIVGNYGAGTLNIIDGGEAASGSSLTLGYRPGSSGTVNIVNGGILIVPYIYRRDTDASATVALDGGTIRAAKDNERLIRAANNFNVTIGANGGTIDAAGYNVTIEEDLDNASGATGAMTFKGGGTVTLSGAINYTGGTTVEAGTVVVVPSVAKRTALGTITVTGLENTICEVVRLSGEGTFSAGDLPADTETVTFAVSPDGKSILAANGLEGPFWIGGSGDLGTASNWSGGVVPTENPTIKWSSPITLTNNGGFAPDTLTIPDDSAVVTLSGALTVNCLTNASRLAVASTGSLTVTGDLVGYAAKNTKPILYSNYGTVTVNGTVRFRSSGTSAGESIVSQYAVADENTAPIIANGLAYHTDSWSDYLVANLGSMNNGVGKWVVGANGFTYPNSRSIWHSGFRVDGQDVTLYSSADWTLAETYRHTGNDLYIISTGTVTIDSTDYNDQTTGRTVTLEGYINAQGSADTPLTITGKGTVVLDSKTANNHTNVVNGAIAVTDTATLQINKDVVIGGAGSISLAAGTTLALDSSALGTIGDTEFTPCFPGLALPAEGTATIRIDGAPLKSGDHVIATVGTGATANVALAPASEALDGRKGALRVDGDQLILNIKSPGMIMIVR